ncbi:MAG: hypothetical protein VB047_09395 [Anaerotignum propionicum]|uniref:hypothetical protein n=1 Tax=Anaerotignum propionicum TaxID=28446 RepID=UPI002B217079|nr:hypothetical protein [Anaerotignum propionicum]MEA5057754.1 hypothetical protein [Anaerotignum propionicum]
MGRIKEIKIKIRPASTASIFHDSRADAKVCMDALNICIEKINEIVQAVNAIQEMEEKK